MHLQPEFFDFAKYRSNQSPTLLVVRNIVFEILRLV